MVDVVTPRKRLTEPTVGGDPNTWGGLLNTDLTLIDTALGGTLALAISGNTGIDSTQAQNTGYVFTGTLGATTTITWPAYSGLAIISNQTTGGRTIVCGIAGQTVSVLPGETAGVWSTGTDFLRFGGGSTSATATFVMGGVVFGGTAGLTQDTPNFFWDATNHRLGLGTNGPVYGLDVNSSNTRLSANAADVFLRLENNTGTGRRWALAVSGTGSLNPAGSLCVQDVTANATRAIFDTSGNLTMSAGGSVVSPIVNVTNQFQVNGSALSAANLSNGTTGSGAVVLSITPGLSSGTRIGSAAGNVSSPTTLNTNVVLYNNSPTNWSGIGSDTGGNFYITTGTSGVQTRFSMSTLGAVRLWNYGFGALQTDSVGNITAGILSVTAGGTGVNLSTGTGSNVLSVSPTFTGNTGFGQASAGNWRSYFHGIGNTSATYSIVAQNSAGAGLLYVRDDGVVELPSYGAGVVSTDAFGNLSAGSPGNLSFIAASATSFSALAFRFGLALYPSDFGAAGDGFTDDSVALQNWLSTGANSHIELRMAAKTYAFNTQLSLNNPTGLTIKGAGAYSSVLLYLGGNTTVDILAIGGSSQTLNITLSDFRIASDTLMSASSGLHLFNVCRSQLTNIIMDGQDGNGNLSTGFYFDQVDAVFLRGYSARAQVHGMLVNGTVGAGPKAGLYITDGKIANCEFGLRIAGGFGGLQIDKSDIIVNTYGIWVDQGTRAEGNREIFIGQNVSVDSSGVDNVVLNDPGGGTISMQNWNASAAGHGLNVTAWPGKIEISGGPYFNNGSDGILIQDSRATIHISPAVQIHDNGGYGINATTGVELFYEGALDGLGNGAGMVNHNAVHLRRPTAQGQVTIGHTSGFELPARSGMITVSNLNNGDTGIYVLGGGSAVLIGTSQGSWVNGFPGFGSSGIRWDGGAYQIVNETGSTAAYSWAMVSSRYAN